MYTTLGATRSKMAIRLASSTSAHNTLPPLLDALVDDEMAVLICCGVDEGWSSICMILALLSITSTVVSMSVATVVDADAVLLASSLFNNNNDNADGATNISFLLFSSTDAVGIASFRSLE